MWDLKRKVYKHYELQNDYGFYTVEINKGKLISDISQIPKKAKLRVICRESIPSQVKEVINEIKETCTLVETTYVRGDEISNDLTLKSGQIFDVHNIFNVDYQNKLIEDALLSKNNTKDIVEKVKELNKVVNKEISKDKVSKNIRWKPKVFEFDNMFSYGEGNIIDFTKLKGTIGLFAPNASGKSSIMDALAFCVFDKFSKGFKAGHVLNTQKMSFRCKFNFEVNGVDYFIEREGKADKKGNVKVEVKFYKIENGNEAPLNGEARRSTNDIIRDYVGTYDDFILTVLSIQNSKSGSFIDLGQTERKDLLCQFMGLDVFDQLYTIANDKFKETNTLLKNISKDQLIQELDLVSNNIDLNNKNIDSYNEDIKSKDIVKEQHNNKLLELSNNIIKADSFNFDITKLESEKIEVESKIYQTHSNIIELKNTIVESDNKLISISSLLTVCENIDAEYDQYKSIKRLFDNKSNELESIKIVIKNKMDKLKKLEDHKYDPNCPYCINNVFVKDAIKVKAELDNDKVKAKIVFEEYNSRKNELDVYGDIETKFKDCQRLNLEKVNCDRSKSTTSNNILKYENDLIKLQSTLKNITDNIAIFYNNKHVIENNSTLMKEINNYKDLIKTVDSDIKSINNKLFNASTEKGRFELQYKNTTDQLIKVKELEESYETFRLYTSVISRDGIPYEIITKTLPEIEKEVNNILQQLVGFTITMQTDGKNIMTNIVYDDRRWPLEMASGMEKFISGLAIRVSLINISNLPRPNIICIDEGFGCADSDHLGQMGALFNYLKHQFDFIWIISHLDVMRDMVDSQIEIKKENGYSKVVYI
jgi:DNA repair exonuclease SbcCD ATPase subunit